MPWAINWHPARQRIIKMKKIIALTMLAAFCFTSSGLAFSKSDINIQLKNSTDLYQKMLAPIWNEIPNDYQWSDKKTTRIWGDNITATLENAHLNLGPVGSELATITHFGDQKLFLKWNLHTLTSNLVIWSIINYSTWDQAHLLDHLQIN